MFNTVPSLRLDSPASILVHSADKPLHFLSVLRIRSIVLSVPSWFLIFTIFILLFPRLVHLQLLANELKFLNQSIVVGLVSSDEGLLHLLLFHCGVTSRGMGFLYRLGRHFCVFRLSQRIGIS